MSWTQIKEKREQVANLVEKSGQILKDAKAEKRELSAEENETFEALHKDTEKLNAEIRQIEMQQKAEKSIEERLGREDIEQPEAEAKNESEERNKAFDKFIRFGANALSVDEKRALSTGGSTAGTELVPEGFHSQFYEVLKSFSGVREAGCTVITTQSGNPYPMPKLNDTGNTGERIGENTQVGTADPVTGSLDLGAYIYSSKVVKVSEALVQDSGYDVQGMLAPMLAKRIGRIQNSEFTTADGSSKPQGIVTGSSAGKVAASTSAVVYAEVLDLIHSLDRSYRDGAKFMFTDATLLALKKLVDGNGNPLFNYGKVDAGFPATIGGYPYVVNNDMAELDDGVSSKVMLFFNPAGYVIRDVIGVTLKVLDQTYADYFQIGYVAGMRSDAGVIDSTAIKHLALAAS